MKRISALSSALTLGFMVALLKQVQRFRGSGCAQEYAQSFPPPCLCALASLPLCALALLTLLALLTTSIHSASAVEGATDIASITVAADGSGDFTSIQQAIDSALQGAIITVYPGTYRENLVIGGKDITLLSQDGPNSTVIDGSQSGPVVVLVDVPASSRLDGFTIQNGSSIRCAGGIHCLNSSPAISHCIIAHNASIDSGGGIGCEQKSSPTISNCLFQENSALAGGGISCDRSSPIIIDCQIMKNLAAASGDSRGGGGIFCYNSAPEITNCTITNNTASCGGGINCFGPTCYHPKITDCTISQNLASGQGGGIYYQCDVLSITNSTIAENSADYGGGIYCTWPITGFATNWTITNCIIAKNSARSGAGINCSGYDNSVAAPEYNFPSPKITNCTIIGNSASTYGGGIFSDLSLPIITNCIIWENSPFAITDRLPKSIHSTSIRRVFRGSGTLINQVPSTSPKITYSNIQGGYKGQGNISLPPLFTDSSSGDYHLQYCSPCIDAGVDPSITEAEMDKENTARPWDGDRDGMPGYDMGAFEFSGFVPPIIWVSLNIYSGEGLNTLTLLSRKIQIAILGNEGFDVTTIDPETILLGCKSTGENIAPTRWSYSDISPGSKVAALLNPYYRTGDGYQDLLLTFSIQKLINISDLRKNGQETICLTLTGKLKDGSTIKGLANTPVPMPMRRQTEGF